MGRILEFNEQDWNNIDVILKEAIQNKVNCANCSHIFICKFHHKSWINYDIQFHERANPVSDLRILVGYSLAPFCNNYSKTDKLHV